MIFLNLLTNYLFCFHFLIRVTDLLKGQGQHKHLLLLNHSRRTKDSCLFLKWFYSLDEPHKGCQFQWAR